MDPNCEHGGQEFASQDMVEASSGEYVQNYDSYESPQNIIAQGKELPDAYYSANHEDLLRNPAFDDREILSPSQESSCSSSYYSTDGLEMLPPIIRTPAQDAELLQHQQFLKSHNQENRSTREEEARTAPIFAGEVMTRVPALYPQYGLLGQMVPGSMDVLPNGQPNHAAYSMDPRILLNVGAPWSAFICGVQGSGKSHSLACILEDCLIGTSPASKVHNPLSGMIFHWDRFTAFSSQQICEAATLASAGIPVRVLVSPSNFEVMKEAYENIPGINSFQRPKVMPLLFNDKQLNVSRMLTLMGVHMDAERPPLYLEVLLRILREMAQASQGGRGLNYAEFRWKLATEAFTDAQNGPLKLRLDLLESFLRSTSESRFQPPGGSRNSEPLLGHDKRRDPTKDIRPLKQLSKLQETDLKDCWTFKPGSLTIVDLSCPFVDENAACALFAMCLELFLEDRSSSGRIIALDEAHKFLTGSSGAMEFTEELLQVIRQQRHLGARIVIATQEPTISPRLLDLCNFTIVHRFQSPEWYKILKSHLAGAWGDQEEDSAGTDQKQAGTSLLKKILNLQLGQALLFAPSAIIGFNLSPNRREIEPVKLGMQSLLVSIRQRLTYDGGRSIMAD